MNWISVAKPDQVPEGEVLGVVAGEHRIALFRHEGAFYATDNVCTHAFALLSDGFMEQGCIECPLHQARFDIRTGKALCAPATIDLATYPVKVDNGQVWVALKP